VKNPFKSEGPREVNRFQREILFGLKRTNRHVYEGTAPANEVAKRRAKNKAARKARRANRLAA
jgi:hypothetical protein